MFTVAATIVLGTALGVGFPDVNDVELAAIAPDLAIEPFFEPEATEPH